MISFYLNGTVPLRETRLGKMNRGSFQYLFWMSFKKVMSKFMRYREAPKALTANVRSVYNANTIIVKNNAATHTFTVRLFCLNYDALIFCYLERINRKRLKSKLDCDLFAFQSRHLESELTHFSRSSRRLASVSIIS